MATVVIHCGMCKAANRVDRGKLYTAVCGKCKHSLLLSPDMLNLPPEEIPTEDYSDPEDAEGYVDFGEIV